MIEGTDVFVVTADAIVGRGCVYERGRIVTTEHLWGFCETFLKEGAVEYVVQPAPLRESIAMR